MDPCGRAAWRIRDLAGVKVEGARLVRHVDPGQAAQQPVTQQPSPITFLLLFLHWVENRHFFCTIAEVLVLSSDTTPSLSHPQKVWNKFQSSKIVG